MKEIRRSLDGPPKNKELWSYVVSFEFSRPKVAQIRLFIIKLDTGLVRKYLSFGHYRVFVEVR